MAGVHQKVVGVVSGSHSEDDRRIELKCRNELRSISDEALGIPRSFACPLPQAVSAHNDIIIIINNNNNSNNNNNNNNTNRK
jgi:hypothetical protein